MVSKLGTLHSVRHLHTPLPLNTLFGYVHTCTRTHVHHLVFESNWAPVHALRATVFHTLQCCRVAHSGLHKVLATPTLVSELGQGRKQPAKAGVLLTATYTLGHGLSCWFCPRKFLQESIMGSQRQMSLRILGIVLHPKHTCGQLEVVPAVCNPFSISRGLDSSTADACGARRHSHLAFPAGLQDARRQ